MVSSKARFFSRSLIKQSFCSFIPPFERAILANGAMLIIFVSFERTVAHLQPSLHWWPPCRVDSDAGSAIQLCIAVHKQRNTCGYVSPFERAILAQGGMRTVSISF